MRNILFYFFNYFAFFSPIYSRLIVESEYDLSSFYPKFEKVETLPNPKQTIIKFQPLLNYTFENKYRLFISELNKIQYHSNLTYFRNWLWEDELYDSFLEKDDKIWNSWINIRETNERILNISNLNASNKACFLIIFN